MKVYWLIVIFTDHILNKYKIQNDPFRIVLNLSSIEVHGFLTASLNDNLKIASFRYEYQN